MTCLGISIPCTVMKEYFHPKIKRDGRYKECSDEIIITNKFKSFVQVLKVKRQ